MSDQSGSGPGGTGHDGSGRGGAERPFTSGVRQVAGFLMAALRLLGRGGLALWRVLRVPLRTALQIALALLILLEEWGWQPLARLLGRLAQWKPWARLETAIARLPPYAALVVFVVPSLFLLPLKFLAVFLIAKGQFVLAGLLFAVAKVAATAIVARLFILTQPALMQIGWFAWGYDTVMPWKDALVEHVRASWVWRVSRFWKERTKRVLAGLVRPWRATVLRLRASMMAAMTRMGALLRRWRHGLLGGGTTPRQ